MITHLVNGVDLERFIYSDVKISENQIKHIMAQLLIGLKGIHSEKVLHLDFKPSNIMINTEYVVTIIDFGSAFNKDSITEDSELLTTLTYRAPEAFEGNDRVDDAVDVWAAGCIMFELFNKEVMLTAVDLGGVEEEYYKVLVGKYTSSPTIDLITDSAASIASDEAHTFIKRILVASGSRASVDDLLDDPWIKDNVALLIKEGSN
jgi:serine/threonine protein kinase